MDELRTERLLLRTWREEDRAPFAALNADPQVMEHFPAPMTREQSDAFVDRIAQHFAQHGYGLWAVDLDGAFLGFTGLQWSSASGADELEVGWRLAREHWGHGYATEAATAALRYGLEQVPRVVSFTAVSNERSARVMQRIGMTYERTFQHPRADLPERIRPHVLYAAERQTWRPHSVLA